MASFDLASLVRPNIAALQPYRCARDDYETGILLDANENSFGTPLAPSSLGQWPAELERYPDPHQKDLKALIGAFRGVQPGNIFVGVGSDESIDLLIRVFCVPGRDSILVSPPTYGMYKVAAATNDVGVVAVPLTPAFDIEADKIIQATKDNAAIKLVFVCTPNNPAAKDVQHAHIVRLLQGITSAVVVVDEAYVDFSELPSMAPLVNTYPNLVVLQTLSKSFGLAGIRLGTSFGSPELIAVLNKVKAPYNVNKLTQALAIKAYSPEGIQQMKANVAAIKGEREWLMAQIVNVPGVRGVFESNANFFIAQVDNALSVYKTMADKGVVVRYRGSELHCTDGLRITVGTRPQNETLLALLAEVLKSAD